MSFFCFHKLYIEKYREDKMGTLKLIQKISLLKSPIVAKCYFHEQNSVLVNCTCFQNFRVIHPLKQGSQTQFHMGATF